MILIQMLKKSGKGGMIPVCVGWPETIPLQLRLIYFRLLVMPTHNHPYLHTDRAATKLFHLTRILQHFYAEHMSKS